VWPACVWCFIASQASILIRFEECGQQKQGKKPAVQRVVISNLTHQSYTRQAADYHKLHSGEVVVVHFDFIIFQLSPTVLWLSFC
jgi:hypothetical protein